MPTDNALLDALVKYLAEKNMLGSVLENVVFAPVREPTVAADVDSPSASVLSDRHVPHQSGHGDGAQVALDVPHGVEDGVTDDSEDLTHDKDIDGDDDVATQWLDADEDIPVADPKPYCSNCLATLGNIVVVGIESASADVAHSVEAMEILRALAAGGAQDASAAAATSSSPVPNTPIPAAPVPIAHTPAAAVPAAVAPAVVAAIPVLPNGLSPAGPVPAEAARKMGAATRAFLQTVDLDSVPSNAGKAPWYCVSQGTWIGVSSEWAFVSPHVNGVGGAVFNKAETWYEARRRFLKARNAGLCDLRV